MLQVSVVHSNPYFIFFWLHWVFAAALRLSLVEASRGYSSLLCAGFSLQQLLIVERGLSSYGAWACCSLAREIFLEYGWNPCPVHWQADSYPLYHQGSPGLCLSEIRASPVSKGLILLLHFSKFPRCSSLSVSLFSSLTSDIVIQSLLLPQIE